MLRKMVDMARSAQEQKDTSIPSSLNTPLYDYGLSLCFNQETLLTLKLMYASMFAVSKKEENELSTQKIGFVSSA